MEFAISAVAVGIFLFLAFGLQECVEVIANSKVKVAEANARSEEARTERAKLEHNQSRT